MLNIQGSRCKLVCYGPHILGQKFLILLLFSLPYSLLIEYLDHFPQVYVGRSPVHTTYLFYIYGFIAQQYVVKSIPSCSEQCVAHWECKNFVWPKLCIMLGCVEQGLFFDSCLETHASTLSFDVTDILGERAGFVSRTEVEYFWGVCFYGEKSPLTSY